MSKPVSVRVGLGGPTFVSEPAGVLRSLLRVARKAIALAVWVYVLLKLFVFDVDAFIFRRFLPGFQWALDYKFFVFLGVVGVVAAIFKRKHVLVFMAYVIFYPVILALWVIPYLIFKSSQLDPSYRFSQLDS